jgi:hypothetical protein
MLGISVEVSVFCGQVLRCQRGAEGAGPFRVRSRLRARARSRGNGDAGKNMELEPATAPRHPLISEKILESFFR